MTAPDGKAVETKSAFRYECGVRTILSAPVEKVWNLLSDTAAYSKWNSTILSFEGSLALDGEIKVKSVLDEKRTFVMRVSEFQPPNKMTWSDGMAPFFRGDRTYTLTPLPDGTTEFSFVEVLKGILLPMVAGSLPDFPSIFEQVARDIKFAVEKPANNT